MTPTDVLSLQRHTLGSLAICTFVVLSAGCDGSTGTWGDPGHTSSNDGGWTTPIAPDHGIAPVPKAALSGTPFSWDVYQVIVPPSLTVATLSDGVALTKAGCLIALWGTVPTQADADAQALAQLTQKMVSSGQVVVGENTASPLDDFTHLNGVSGEGWTYVDLRGRLVRASNHNDELGKVRVLLANLGARSAVITGFQPLSATDHCLDEVLNPYEWILLYYSLSFPGFQGNRSAFRTALLGGWFGVETGAYIDIAWGDLFAANGRHTDVSVLETFRQISPTEYLDTTSGWSGNGAWDVDGNKLTVWPDDPMQPAVTQYIRVAAEHGSFIYLHRLDLCEGGVYCEGWSTKDQ